MRDHGDVTDALRRIDPVDDDQLFVAWSDSSARRALREEITVFATHTDADTGPATGSDDASAVPTPRRRGPALLAAATVAIGAVATAAIVVNTTNTTSVTCRFTPGVDVGIDASSGDPVVDCTSEWSRLSTDPAPVLEAYRTSRGHVVVVPEATTPEAGWTPLVGVAQDPAVLELRAVLGDIVDGLGSRCFTTDEAATLVRTELVELGLAGWSVIEERGTADGRTTCAWAMLDGDGQQVVLHPEVPGAVAGLAVDEPYNEFARAVAAELDADCLDLEAVVAVIEEVARRTSVDGPSMVATTTIVDPAAACARVEVTVGGRIEVVVRGPGTE